MVPSLTLLVVEALLGKQFNDGPELQGLHLTKAKIQQTNTQPPGNADSFELGRFSH